MLTSTTGVSRGDSLKRRGQRASKPSRIRVLTDERSAAPRKHAGEEGPVPERQEAATKVFTAAELLTAAQDLQYRLGHAEARVELAERAESNLRAERDRLIEDLKRERQRAEQLGREKLEAQRVADRIAQEREEAREEARRLREELTAERDKGFFRRLFGR
jgi:hypothetical protein